MKATFSLFPLWITLCLSTSGSDVPLPSASPSPVATLDERQTAFLKDYCVECHNEEKQKGKLRLDNISMTLDTVERADRWQKILNQINAGEMPPEDAKQPESRAKTDFLETLSNTLVTARRTLGDSGGKILVRRLNRREYRNTIADLLGVEVDVRSLPADGGAGTFDTVGSSLFMSSDQVEQYLALGRRALDDAFALHQGAAKPFKMHSEREQVADIQLRGAVQALRKRAEPYEQWTAAVDAVSEKVENRTKTAEIRVLDEVKKDPRRFYRHWSEWNGAPSPKEFGFKDAADGESVMQQYQDEKGYVDDYFKLPHVDKGSYLFVFIVRPQEALVAPKEWPPGQYILRVRMGAVEGTPTQRHFIECGHPSQPGAFDILSAHHITGTIDQPQTLEIPVTLTSNGSRTFAIREKRLNSREEEVAIAEVYRRKHKTWYPPAMWIDWMELEGPINRQMPQGKAPELFAARPQEVSEREHARSVIERFAGRSFRGAKPDTEWIESLVAVFEDHRKAGDSFEISLKESLSVILAAPGFLYLYEPSIPGRRRVISDTELASRLSYFLWSSAPDEELLEIAEEGRLHVPDVLHQQIDRMLGNPKAREFVHGFVQQWLGLARLDFFRFNGSLYPEFDDSAKIAARSEVFETFAHLLRSNSSLSRLLKSDQVVINGLLAKFYGIDGVSGDAFRPVSIPADSPRGGLLGMSAILAMGSNGERTSPVERGAWILRKMLHDPPPPAPPNVPQLSRLAQKPLGPRELLLAHQQEPQCASCHRKIDPIGFGLENFDAIGRWRQTETYLKQPGGRKAWPIEVGGAFHRGPAFADFFELRNLIAGKVDAFAQGFSEALVEYALGRPIGFTDEPLVREMVEKAGRMDFALREFVHALVCSQEFRMK